jgi:hypothetical protein
VAQVTATPLASTSATAAKAAGLEVLPNPVANRLTLQATRSLGGGNVTVFNALGQVVLTSKTYAPVLDVSSLAPGIYTVSWLNGKQRLTKRFVKQAE